MWSGSVMQIFALLVTGHAQFVVPGFEQKKTFILYVVPSKFAQFLCT